MSDHAAGRDPRRLSRCVCDTLRMVSRAVTQLYDDALRPSGLRVTQFSILAAIARKDEANLRELIARPLWAQAQQKVLREIGTKAWADAQRRLTRLLQVAVAKRR